MWHNADFVSCMSKINVGTFTPLQLTHLPGAYKYMYPLINFENAIVSSSFYRATEISVAGDIFGSSISRNSRSSYIIAYWVKSDGQIREYNSMGLTPHPGLIKYFVKHSLMVGDKSYTHWFAYCDWFLPINDTLKNMFGKPVEVWNRTLFDLAGPASFIPVSRIVAKFVHAKFAYRNKDLMVIVPRLKHSCF